MRRSLSRASTCLRRSLCRGVLALIVVQGLLTSSVVTAVEGRDQPDHQAITLAVEAALLKDNAVHAHLIDVNTRDGVVTLSGWVDSLLGKERAGEIAETFKGVRAVINRIAITTARPDEEVLKAVRTALRADPATDSYEVEAAVRESVVTLFGSVDSWPERHLSAQVAKSVKGVKAVINELTVKPQAQRPDHEIATDIRRRLAADVWVDERQIEVAVQEGTVRLNGIVGSAAEKSRAALAAWVAGVETVDESGMRVDWQARDSYRREHPHVVRTDEGIIQALYDALRYDPRVLAFQPEVRVRGGVVTLTGTVDNLAAKRAAEQDARHTIGVRRVRNYLRVRPVTLVSDDELAEQIRAALGRDVYTERHKVIVTAVNGKAYLSGVVDSPFEKERAEDVVSRVPGVIAVANNMTVTARPPPKSDWEIAQDIKDELWWSPFIDSEQITVSVEDGIVTLKGQVDDWAEQRAAMENAYEGGARSVRSEITLKDGSTE